MPLESNSLATSSFLVSHSFMDCNAIWNLAGKVAQWSLVDPTSIKTQRTLRVHQYLSHPSKTDRNHVTTNTVNHTTSEISRNFSKQVACDNNVMSENGYKSMNTRNPTNLLQSCNILCNILSNAFVRNLNPLNTINTINNLNKLHKMTISNKTEISSNSNSNSNLNSNHSSNLNTNTNSNISRIANTKISNTSNSNNNNNNKHNTISTNKNSNGNNSRTNNNEINELHVLDSDTSQSLEIFNSSQEMLYVHDENVNLSKFHHHDVGWRDLNKSKFYFLIPFGSLSVRVIIFPFSLVKTQLQARQLQAVGSSNVSNKITMTSVIKRIIANEGIFGFYKGFGVSLLGLINGPIYTTTFEISRETIYDNLKKYFGNNNYTYNNNNNNSKNNNKHLMNLSFGDASLKTLSYLLGGFSGSCVAQTIQTPIDVISQRRMVIKHNEVNKSPFTILKDLLNENPNETRFRSFLGLWRGYYVSVLTYAPLSGIVWAGFFTNKHFLFSKFNIISNETDREKEISPQWQRSSLTFIAAGSAGAAGAWLTMPLDTVCCLKKNTFDLSII